MRRLVIIFIFIFGSALSHAEPGKRLTREERQLSRDERQKARIERQYARKSAGLEERRDPDQKQKDRAAMIFLVITAAMIVGAMGKGDGN